MLGELILHHSDNLSKTLQASHISAAEGQKIATMMVKTLQSIRKDGNFWSIITVNLISVILHCHGKGKFQDVMR